MIVNTAKKFPNARAAGPAGAEIGDITRRMRRPSIPNPDNVGKPVVRHMFDGSVGEKSRRLVAMRQYSLPRDQRGLTLDVPQEGMLLMQLRAGELATIINGERRQRLEGEWWTVSPPSAMRLETGDNTVVIDTILIGE